LDQWFFECRFKYKFTIFSEAVFLELQSFLEGISKIILSKQNSSKDMEVSGFLDNSKYAGQNCNGSKARIRLSLQDNIKMDLNEIWFADID
jgi:hypothetical protein